MEHPETEDALDLGGAAGRRKSKEMDGERDVGKDRG